MLEHTREEYLSLFKCRSVGETFTEDDWVARDLLFAERRALQEDRRALEKLTADIRAYFRLKSEMDTMVQYGRDPGEDAYDRLDAIRAQLPA